MKIFIAGNFPQMKDPEKELEAYKRARRNGITYKRLISFFYKDDVESIFDLKRGGKSGDKPSRLIKNT